MCPEFRSKCTTTNVCEQVTVPYISIPYSKASCLPDRPPVLVLTLQKTLFFVLSGFHS
jgi:hypothetical protein